MNIRRAIPFDRGVLVDIWLRSVRATHTFLSEEDIQSLLPPTRDYLTPDGPELWVLCTDAGVVVGFMGMSGSKMEAQFLDPEFHRQGGGRRLVRHAQELHGELTASRQVSAGRPQESRKSSKSRQEIGLQGLYYSAKTEARVARAFTGDTTGKPRRSRSGGF